MSYGSEKVSRHVSHFAAAVLRLYDPLGQSTQACDPFVALKDPTGQKTHPAPRVPALGEARGMPNHPALQAHSSCPEGEVELGGQVWHAAPAVTLRKLPAAHGMQDCVPGEAL